MVLFYHPGDRIKLLPVHFEVNTGVTSLQGGGGGGVFTSKCTGNVLVFFDMPICVKSQITGSCVIL